MHTYLKYREYLSSCAISMKLRHPEHFFFATVYFAFEIREWSSMRKYVVLHSRCIFLSSSTLFVSRPRKTKYRDKRETSSVVRECTGCHVIFATHFEKLVRKNGTVDFREKEDGVVDFVSSFFSPFQTASGVLRKSSRTISPLEQQTYEYVRTSLDQRTPAQRLATFSN